MIGFPSLHREGIFDACSREAAPIPFGYFSLTKRCDQTPAVFHFG